MTFSKRFKNYALAPIAVGAAFLFYLIVTYLTGHTLPPYITFYPAVMIMALAGGLGPGLAATALAALVVDYFIIPPPFQLGVLTAADTIGIVLFCGMGILMSVVAHLYLRLRDKLERTVADRTAELKRSNEQLKEEIEARQQSQESLGKLNAELEHRVAEQVSQIRRANETLEQRIAERTAELQAANVTLRTSRLAALNIMEDAVEARKHAEQAEELLRLEQERLDLALKSASMGVWRWEIIEDKRYFDDQTCHLLGIDASAFTGAAEEFFRVVNPEYRDKLKMSLARTIEENRPYESEYEVTWPDGSIHYLTARGRLTRDEDGRPVMINGIIWDMTERKKIEVSLRESEEQLRLAAMAAEIGMWSWRPGTNYVTISANWRRLFGVSNNVLVTFDTWRDALHPDDRERAVSELNAASDQHREFNVEYRVVHPDGTVRWITDRGRAWYDEQGRPVGMAGVNVDITERKQAEEALRESREDLNRAQQVAMTGSWRLDTKSNKLTWSDEAYRIFGVPIGTGLTYEMFLAYIHPDDKEYVNIKWKAALAGEKYDIEHRIVVDGQIKWVRERAELELEKDGSISGGFGTVTDITARKEDEATLLREKNFSDTTIDSLPGVFYLFNEKGRFLRWNKNFEKVAGYSSSEMANISPIDLFGGDDKKLIAERIHDVIEKGETIVEASFVTKSGLRIPYFFTGRRIMFDQKPCVVGMGVDISQRKQMEEELRNSRDELEIRVKERTADLDEAVLDLQKQVEYRIKAEEASRSASLYARGLLEASLDPMVTISPEGKITDVNKATEFVTGVSRDQLIGTDFSNYFTEPEKARQSYQQVFAKGFVTDYPLTILHKNGRLTDVLYNATVYKDTQGNVLGVFAAARDITEKKADEAELEKYRLHLEELVKNRTEELSRSNKDLEQFAYVASHDLQEPLRAVSGFVELLRRNLDKSLDEKTNEYMNFAIDGAKRMQSLINGLLEYSRIGTQGKKPQKINSKEVLDEALARLHASIGESSAKITADDLPTVYFDDMQLTRLFQNLIGNAIKFRSEQVPQIHVSAVRKDDVWQFAIRDNGIGIEPQYAERIFMIFQRLHTRKTYPGTGIGLSICKKIVERHGGRIWVESAQGQGSTFYFTVPDIEETEPHGQKKA